MSQKSVELCDLWTRWQFVISHSLTVGTSWWSVVRSWQAVSSTWRQLAKSWWAATATYQAASYSNSCQATSSSITCPSSLSVLMSLYIDVKTWHWMQQCYLPATWMTCVQCAMIECLATTMDCRLVRAVKVYITRTCKFSWQKIEFYMVFCGAARYSDVHLIYFLCPVLSPRGKPRITKTVL